MYRESKRKTEWQLDTTREDKDLITAVHNQDLYMSYFPPPPQHFTCVYPPNSLPLRLLIIDLFEINSIHLSS